MGPMGSLVECFIVISNTHRCVVVGIVFHFASWRVDEKECLNLFPPTNGASYEREMGRASYDIPERRRGIVEGIVKG